MPKGAIPEKFFDILEAKGLVNIATVDPQGRPEVNPAWFIFQDGQIWLSITEAKHKYKNLVNNPAIALSFIDAENGYRYLEVRGTISEIVLDENRELINAIAQKYTGADFAFDAPGTVRYKFAVNVESWTTNA